MFELTNHDSMIDDEDDFIHYCFRIKEENKMQKKNNLYFVTKQRFSSVMFRAAEVIDECEVFSVRGSQLTVDTFNTFLQQLQ